MKIIKVAVILVFLFFITSSFWVWLAEDSKEIKELIKHVIFLLTGRTKIFLNSVIQRLMKRSCS